MKTKNKTKKKPVTAVKKRNKIKIKTEAPKKNKITDVKLRKFLDFKHIDELYITLCLLNEADTKRLIGIYRSSAKKIKKNRIVNEIMIHSGSKTALLEELKKEIVVQLTEEYNEIYQKVSTYIRQGNDLFIEELKLMKIPLKTKIFGVTGDKKDFYCVKKIIDTIKKDLANKGLN